MKIAFITGISGQDGSYLTELLLKKGYIVYGMIRRTSLFNRSRIEHLLDKINLRYGDVLDLSNIVSILNEIKEKYTWISSSSRLEVYHLAAQSHVMVSFEVPIYTGHTDGIGTLNMLEALRMTNLQARVKFYNAATSELFGQVQTIPQNEMTPFYPRSPYSVAKLYSYWITKNYREAYNMFTVNGILFNHTSPRRGENFVEKKITSGVEKIVNGLDEIGIDASSGKILVQIDKKYFRPSEVEQLLGDSTKLYNITGWKPSRPFEEILQNMINI